MAARDFNGDGRGDVLLGAPLADGTANARSNAGDAYVILAPQAPTPTATSARTATPTRTASGMSGTIRVE